MGYDQADKNFDDAFDCPRSTAEPIEDDAFDDDKYQLNEDDLADAFGADFTNMVGGL